MREFYYFIRHLRELLVFVRGVLVILFSIVFVCAVLLMHSEGLSFGDSLYLTAITALTVGYGDIAPKTTTGRVVSVVVAFVGVVFTGLVVAVATRALAHAVEDERRHGRGRNVHSDGHGAVRGDRSTPSTE